MNLRIAILVAAAAVGPALAQQEQWQPTDGWYMPHHDAMRSGRSQFSPAGPFRLVWRRNFWEGILSPEVEPIVAEGLVFIGDWGDTFYALDAGTGETAWSAEAAGGVRHSAAYADGRIVYATLGDRTGGAVVCRSAEDGGLLWRFAPAARGGFATSPLIYRERVYIGGRDGVLYCLSLAEGEQAWRYEGDAPFLQCCAARDGRVIVAAEDMIPRCFAFDTGEQLWQGERMQGDSVRFYYPVFWRDTVIFRTCAPDNELNRYQSAVQTAAGEDGEALAAVHEEHGWDDPYWEFVRNKWRMYSPEEYLAEQQAIRDDIAQGRLQQTFYWLNVADGTEHAVAAVGYTGSENGHSTPTPPCVDAEGNLYVLYKTFWTQYEYHIRMFDSIGTLDYETGIAAMLPKDPPGHSSLFPITADEANIFTVGGDRLYNTHDHNFAYWEMDTHRVLPGFAPKSRSETWGGVLLTGQGSPSQNLGPLFALETPSAHLEINTEWNGTSRGSVAIVGDRVWWATGSMLICLEGNPDE